MTTCDERSVSMLAVRRRRVRQFHSDVPLKWIADDHLSMPDDRVAVAFEPDRTWCLSAAGDLQAPRRIDTFWRLLDRWSRGGRFAVQSGAPDVYRVVRRPAPAVRRLLAAWPAATLTSGSTSFRVERVGPSMIHGVLTPRGSRSAHVEIRFEDWSSNELCAHLRPVGRSAGRVGSARWWSAAHGVLDELVARIEAA